MQIEYIETVPFKLILLPPMSLRNDTMRREYKHATPSWKEVNRFVAKYVKDKLAKPCVFRQFLSPNSLLST